MKTVNLNYALDADVIIAFVKLKKINLLLDLYLGDFYLFDRVKKEIGSDYNILKKIMGERIKEIILNTAEHQNEIEEYLLMRGIGTIGKGEAQLMAYCKYHRDKVILLSNNFRDIIEYCEKNSIKYYTLCDILKQLYDKKFIEEKDASRIYDFWIQKNIRLPYISFEDLLKKHNN